MKCAREHIREAAVWMSLLRGPERTAQLERGFNRWLKADARHAAAFETISTAWEATGALKVPPLARLGRWERAGFRAGFLGAAAAVLAVCVLAFAGFLYVQHAAGISTAVGEQRTLSLEDGSRVVLNTSTKSGCDMTPAIGWSS